MSGDTSIDRSVIEQITSRVGDLPPLPSVASRVLALVSNGSTTIDDLTREISKDQALTAKVLRVSNSAFYGLSRRITTVREAAITLGMNNIRNIVLALSAQTVMSGKSDGYGLTDGKLWDHSIAVATCSERLSRRKGLRRLGEEAFAAGLLHDIGKLVLGEYVGDRYARIIQLVESCGKTFSQAESEELGFDHAEIGARVALKWNLPGVLVEAIGDHHEPSHSVEAPLLVSVVHISDAVCTMLGFGIGADGLMSSLDPFALDTVGIDKGVLDELMSEMADLSDMRSYYNLG